MVLGLSSRKDCDGGNRVDHMTNSLQRMCEPSLSMEIGGVWGLLVEKCHLDSSEGGVECKPGWNKIYTKGFDLSKQYAWNHACLRIAGGIQDLVSFLLIGHCSEVFELTVLPPQLISIVTINEYSVYEFTSLVVLIN